MLSSKQIGGTDLTEAVKPGSAVRWVLANDGSVAWPTGTTLRLVSGPMVAAPIMEVPSAAPGLTVEMELELVSDKDDVEVAYALVTPCGQPFGDLLQFRVEKMEVETPICVTLKAPETCVEGLQGEVKMMRWTLANISKVSWPKDACCQLFYNTPGFANLPCSIEMPEEVPAGMTVEVEVPVLLPEKEGHFKAMWAVTSPSVCDFGEVLIAEFQVSDFPFMEWMLAEEAEVGSFSLVSSAPSEAAPELLPVSTPAATFSAEHLMHEHVLPTHMKVTYPEDLEGKDGYVSLGSVEGCGAWVVQIILKNDGTVPWPQDCGLACCFGSGFGCARLPMDSVQPGEGVCLTMELEAKDGPSMSGWVLSSGDTCFGPVFLAQVS